MKIAIFSDSYLPVINGVSLAIHTLVTELLEQGVHVTVFAPAFPRHKDADPDVIRFRSSMTPWTKGYPMALPPFLGTLRRFRRREFDLIHSHTPYTVGFCALRWAESFGIPLVSTYHTLYDKYAHYVPYYPHNYVAYKIAKHTNYYYNRVNHVITPSEAGRDSLLRHDVRKPITIIPTGIPVPPRIDRQEARKRLGIPADEFTMLYVGRLAPEKNLELLFHAMRRWHNTIPHAKLRLVGGGAGRKAEGKVVSDWDIGSRVVFEGQVSRDQVDVYFSAADLFVFPSTTETQGLVIGEAQVMGLPAIAVRGGGAHEIIRDGVDGCVVEDSVEAFAHQVEALEGDRTRLRAMGENGRSNQTRWTPLETAERVLDVYETVLGRRVEVRSDDRVAVNSRTE